MEKIIWINLMGALDRILLFHPFPCRDKEPYHGFQPAIDGEYLDKESAKATNLGLFRKQEISPYQVTANLPSPTKR